MKVFTSLFAFLFLIALHAQDPTLKDITSYTFPSGLTASKTKAAIAWAANKEGVRNVYHAFGPDYTPQKTTDYPNDDGQVISDLCFTTDHRAIIFTRGGTPNREGWSPNPTSDPQGVERAIYRVDLANGVSKKLDDGSSPSIVRDKILYKKKGTAWLMDLDGKNAARVFKVRGSLGKMVVSPDHSKMAFVNHRGDHSFIGVFDFEKDSLLFCDPSIDLDSNPVWSPDGSQIAFLRFPFEKTEMFVPKREGMPFSIWIADVTTGKGERIFVADNGMGSVFRFISAENQLFWTDRNTLIFPWEKEGWTHLYSIPVTGGSPTLLTPGNFEVQYVSQSPDRSTLIFNSNQDDRDRQHLWSYGLELKQVSSGKSIEWLPVTDGAGQTFCIGSTATQPANIKRITENGLKNITDNSDYPTKILATPIPVQMTALDGIVSYGQLFLPKRLKKKQKVPAVIHFHGGSRRQMLLGFHHRDYYHHAYAMNQFLAHRGYIVLSLNYRSGIGYGMLFREALKYGASGASEYQDVLAAAKLLQDHPNVDTSRIGLWGGSYGGYLTALGLAKNSDIFKAGVDIHGVYDWNSVIKGFIPSYNKLEVPEFAKLAYDSSPAAVMEGWKSPVLLIHGDDDRNVPFSETVLKAQKLREMGVYVEQLVFPDEVHGFLLHKTWLETFAASVQFLDKTLRK